MIEAGVVLDINGGPIYWHLPAGRTGGSIPDSQVLWEVLWDNKEILGGFAHSHPGGGRPYPSREDVTTFSAVERALGARLKWWITSSDMLIVCRWNEAEKSYEISTLPNEPTWANDLRKISNE